MHNCNSIFFNWTQWNCKTWITDICETFTFRYLFKEVCRYAIIIMIARKLKALLIQPTYSGPWPLDFYKNARPYLCFLFKEGRRDVVRMHMSSHKPRWRSVIDVLRKEEKGEMFLNQYSLPQTLQVFIRTLLPIKYTSIKKYRPFNVREDPKKTTLHFFMCHDNFTDFVYWHLRPRLGLHEFINIRIIPFTKFLCLTSPDSVLQMRHNRVCYDSLS